METIQRAKEGEGELVGDSHINKEVEKIEEEEKPEGAAGAS